MKNKVFSKFKLFFAVALVASSLMLSGCSFISGMFNSGSIYGTWESSFGETFEISNKEFKNLYTYAGISNVSYAGDNVTVEKDSDSAGRIFIKYTQAFNANDIGKWYAISYKDLTDTSVSLSGAFKLTGTSSCETLKQAKEEFTVSNGYFAIYSECVKTK